ncbi:MAG: RNA polymerase sigma factor, partial [Tepidiformaceae bacterium]
MTGVRRETPARPAGGPPAPSDAELLLLVGARDEEALLALYDRYHRLLLSLAIRIVGDRLTAEEVLQDAFLRVWEGSASYNSGRGAVSAWLFGIVRNRAIDALRSRQHRARARERESIDDHPGGSQPDLADGATTRIFVRQALDALPPQQRRPLEMVYYSGLTHREAALALGEPLGTTKGRIRAALDRLRTML